MFGKSMAHIEQIVKTYPLEGADAVEMAQVLDWHVVVRKGQFKAGDMAVYIEMDSIFPDLLPDQYLSEMNMLVERLGRSLRAKNKARDENEIALVKKLITDLSKRNPLPATEILRSRKFKVRCVSYPRFNIISQGILFNVDELLPAGEYTIGQDVTETLKITQNIEDAEEAGVFIPPVIHNPIKRFIDKHLMKFSIYRKIRLLGAYENDNWYSFFPSKSDQKNAQAVFTRIKNNHGDKKWYVTEKLEGQNISTHLRITEFAFGLFKWYRFGVCSHVRSIPSTEHSQFWHTVNRLEYKKKLKHAGMNVFVRGEHIGVKIQKNIYGLPSTDIYIFDVYKIDTKEMMPYDELVKFCKDNEFKMAPVLDDNFTLPETVQELLEYSNGNSILADKVMREGIVIRLKDNPTVSFKVRSPKYLELQAKKQEKES